MFDKEVVVREQNDRQVLTLQLEVESTLENAKFCSINLEGALSMLPRESLFLEPVSFEFENELQALSSCPPKVTIFSASAPNPTLMLVTIPSIHDPSKILYNPSKLTIHLK